MRPIGLVLVLLLGVVDYLTAQWPSGITSGARVQVRLPEVQYQWNGPRGHLVRGRVTALSSDTLYLTVADSVGQLPIPRRLIERLEYSRGVPSRLESALRRGLVSGAASAVFLVLLAELNDEPDGWSTGEAALIGGGVGFATGAVFGAIFPLERWKKVRLEPR